MEAISLFGFSSRTFFATDSASAKRPDEINALYCSTKNCTCESILLLVLALSVDGGAIDCDDSRYTKLVPARNLLEIGAFIVSTSVEKMLNGKPNLSSLCRSCRSPLDSTTLNSSGTQTCHSMSAVGIGVDGLAAVCMVASNGATSSISVLNPINRTGVSYAIRKPCKLGSPLGSTE